MRVSAALAATVLFIAGSSTAHAMSAGELLSSCDAALRTMKGSGAELSIAPAGQRCWSYMEPVQDFIALGDENGQRLLGVCVPESGRTEGLVRAFTIYAHAHSDQLNSRASVVILYALRDKFPCK